MSKQWMRCQIHKGMFSDEVVVVIKTKGGERASFFVPRTEVKNAEHSEAVRVQIVGETGAWAVVPNEDQAIVSVDQSEILAA